MKVARRCPVCDSPIYIEIPETTNTGISNTVTHTIGNPMIIGITTSNTDNDAQGRGFE